MSWAPRFQQRKQKAYGNAEPFEHLFFKTDSSLRVSHTLPPPPPTPPAALGVLDPIQEKILLPFFPCPHPSAAPRCGAAPPAGAPSPSLQSFTFPFPRQLQRAGVEGIQ